VVLHAIALFNGVFRPAEPRLPAGGVSSLLDLPVRIMSAFLNCSRFFYVDGAGFGGFGEVDLGLGAIVNVGRNGYSLDSVAMKSFRYLLLHVRMRKRRAVVC
jgi:hypothetical protein